MLPDQISQQPAPPASGAEAQASTPEPQPKESLTAEDVRKIAREEAVRTSQSLTDKSEARMKKHLETLKASGVQVTPEQERGLRATITKEVMDEEHGGTASLQPQQPKAPGQPINPVIADALDMMTEEGVQIEDADPELEPMLKVLTDSKASKVQRTKAVAAAIDAKRERTNQDAENAHLRTPTGGGDSSSDMASSAHDYYKKAWKDKK